MRKDTWENPSSKKRKTPQIHQKMRCVYDISLEVSLWNAYDQPTHSRERQSIKEKILHPLSYFLYHMGYRFCVRRIFLLKDFLRSSKKNRIKFVFDNYSYNTYIPYKTIFKNALPWKKTIDTLHSLLFFLSLSSSLQTSPLPSSPASEVLPLMEGQFSFHSATYFEISSQKSMGIKTLARSSGWVF